MKTRRPAGIALILALTLLVAACGDDDPESAAGTDGGDSAASGDVSISGSSTVEPISVRVAELLADVNADIAVDVDGPGTGDGFALFCEGTTDISDVSRAIKDEEAALCEEAGIEFIEIEIAKDGLSVLTNPANEAVECLSFADLYALMGPESADVENWSDAAALATELGSTTEFPDAPLEISAPGAESGTFDSFIELALQDVYDARVEAGDAEAEIDPPIRNFPGQSDDTIILQGIEGSDASFGWVGFAFAEGAGDDVKEIAISEEPGGDCVEPTAETIAADEYPLSRPLFIYVNKAKAEENPAIGAYVDFYLGEGYAAVADAGYVELDDEALTASTERWEARTAGAA